MEALITLLNPPSPSPGMFNFVNTKNTDVVSEARAYLTALKSQVDAAIPGTADKMSKYHLEDVSFRIKKALDPKG